MGSTFDPRMDGSDTRSTLEGLEESASTKVNIDVFHLRLLGIFPRLQEAEL